MFPSTTATKKWNSSAGPRQTKAVVVAIGELQTRGRSTREITDYNPEGSILISFFSPISPAVAERLEAIGEKYGWEINAKNHKSIIADCQQAAKEVTIPTVDKRTTQAERDRLAAERAAADAKRAAAERQRQEVKAAKLTELRTAFPWAKQDGSDHARAAANIKRELTERFPNVKFSVRSSTYSGGDSVGVHWQDGPTSREVDEIIGKYAEGSFDGMEDLYKYDNSGEFAAVKEWLGCAKYVHASREYGVGTLDKVVSLLKSQDRKWDSHGNDSAETAAFRLWAATSFPVGRAINGIDFRGDDESTSATIYKLTFDGESPEVASDATKNETEIDSSKCRIEKHYHTKHHFDFWIVVLIQRVDRGEFDRLRQTAEVAGGWYSRAWGKSPGGFAFKSQAAAESFAATL